MTLQNVLKSNGVVWHNAEISSSIIRNKIVRKILTSKEEKRLIILGYRIKTAWKGLRQTKKLNRCNGAETAVSCLVILIQT